MQFGLRTLLFVVLLLGMLVSSYPLLFKRLNEQRQQAIDQTKDKQDQLNKLAGKLAMAPQDIKAEIDTLHSAITFLHDKLPQEQEMDKVLTGITKAAADSSLNVKSVRLGAKPVQDDNYSSQTARMVLEGSYDGFYKFLSNVEQMPRLTKINDMKIEADPKNNGAVMADLTLTVYYEASKVAVAQ
jgi:Tfp pilus assembly protein PilO